MIVRCDLLILYLCCATTSVDGWFNTGGSELGSIYSSWPSVHNAARLMKLRKRETQGQIGQNEGGGTEVKTQISDSKPPEQVVNTDNKQLINTHDVGNNTVSQESPKANGIANESQKNVTNSASSVAKVANNSVVKGNETTSSQLDINNPGVLKRGLIVFGGFALMAGAYFICFWNKSKKNDINNSHSNNDANQFRYGVLQSDDGRDNMELSRIPLTMDSDDDDDEDLEIFDLGQKKKSLSYVNLKTQEDDAVTNTIDIDKDKDNLLLDIEDASSDTLINWANNENKSIL